MVDKWCENNDMKHIPWYFMIWTTFHFHDNVEETNPINIHATHFDYYCCATYYSWICLVMFILYLYTHLNRCVRIIFEILMNNLPEYQEAIMCVIIFYNLHILSRVFWLFVAVWFPISSISLIAMNLLISILITRPASYLHVHFLLPCFIRLYSTVCLSPVRENIV